MLLTMMLLNLSQRTLGSLDSFSFFSEEFLYVKQLKITAVEQCFYLKELWRNIEEMRAIYFIAEQISVIRLHQDNITVEESYFVPCSSILIQHVHYLSLVLL